MSDLELDLSDYDDELDLDSEQEEDYEDEPMISDSNDAEEGPDVGSSTPLSVSGFNKGKGKARASFGGGSGGSDERLYGQVEYGVLSLSEIEAEQKQGIDYVEDMLKLKVSRPF